ncbi:hypothetical protein [Microbacterium arborescens]|uniref:hypothetical protein n=1 Tax=Microbacterium arborescens TaxID=33883 RepID=UPI003C791565
MRWITNPQTAAVIGATGIVAISLLGCTAPSAEQDVEKPSASATLSPSPTPTADARSDEEQLPMPVEDIRDWAGTAVPQSSNLTGTGILSGWLSQNTSAHHVTEFASLASGSYRAQIACRGAGTITLTAGQIGSDPAIEPLTCANGTTAFDVTIEQTGLSVTLDLEGDPTVYALSFVRA